MIKQNLLKLFTEYKGLSSNKYEATTTSYKSSSAANYGQVKIGSNGNKFSYFVTNGRLATV